MRLYTLGKDYAHALGSAEAYSLMHSFLQTHKERLNNAKMYLTYGMGESHLEKMRDQWTQFLPTIFPELQEIVAKIPFVQMIERVRREMELIKTKNIGRTRVWNEYLPELSSFGLKSQAEEIRRDSKTAEELDVRLDLLLSQSKKRAEPRSEQVREENKDHDAMGYYSYASKQLDNS